MGPNGQPSLVTAAPSPSLANPMLGPQVQKATNEATASQYAPATASADATIKGADASVANTVANAQARKAEADAIAAQAQAQTLSAGGPKMDPKVRADAISGYNYAQQLQDTIDELNTLFQKGPGATKGLEGLKDYMPYTANQAFDTQANAARGIVGQTLGFTGGQLNTEREAAKAIGPYLPQAGDRDAVIVQKIQKLQELADHGRAKAAQVLGGVPDANGNINPVGSNPLPPIGNPEGAGAGFATGRTRDVVDPALHAVSTKVGVMLSNGTPGTQIEHFLKSSGVDPASTDLSARLKYRATPEFKRWQRANPGAPYPMDRSMYVKKVPMSEVRSLTNQAASNDIIGSGMAAAGASANAITGGRLDNMVGALSGEPATAKTGMEMLRGAHPYSSFAGDMAGQASLEALAGTVPGAQGLMATRYGRRGADALYGAYSGSGEGDGGGVGAATGALSGLGLGMFGRGTQKALGNAATGIQDASLGYLNKAGIPLTLGRIARGVGEIDPHAPTNVADEVGKGIGGIEERLMGLPGLDAVIGTARQRGDAAFNNETFRQIAPGVGGRGAEGLASAKLAETAAYAKLNPVRIAVDPQFDSALSSISPSALPHHAGDVANVVQDIRDQINNGEMSGKGYQVALRAIRKTRATLNDDVGGKAADTLTGLERHVVDLGTRQGGQVAQDLAEANAIHARREIVKAASKSSVAQRAGQMFSPAALNQNSIRNTEKFGGLDKALSPDRPFFDLTNAGMNVMPNLTPDSGTAGRMALYRALGTAGAGLGGGIGALAGDGGSGQAAEGGGIGLGGGVALGTLLSAPYSHAGQKLIQKALLAERPRMIKKLGEFLINRNPKYAGMFGSAVGRDYFFQPELPQ